ncbi:ATP-binding protein [Nocardioides nematodiphilus]|uniref:ATP-binding protein n=1 Tax=Nocardioides nematodiphilus TaxID=2849669 RepID=UPI001CD933A7|nr:ATP-binding protein [Nocardioides nematodiphilus]MCA1983475.1 PspC domain-containing protein [Nocardioides nematodiphilus]
MSGSDTAAKVRRATRDTEVGVVGGVAAGLAHHLRLPVLWVRVFFVAAALLDGMGVALYAGLWLMLPAAPVVEAGTPGAESATRGGRRPGPIRRLTDVGPAIAGCALAFGAVLLVESIIGAGTLFWPVVVGLAGVTLLWRQADEAQRERWLDARERVDPIAMVFGRGGWAAYARVAAGVLLVLVAFALFEVRGGSIADAGRLLVAFGLGVAGIGVIVGPWALRLYADLGAERAERVRTQERADMAAHLHDSVLQTLALIQKNAAHPATVARLARAQERDLRGWLYDESVEPDASVAAALKSATAEVEDAHGVVVDVVVVGDAPLSPELLPLVAACREAVTNAAKHAGVPRVDVYAEVLDEAVEVFVRDRGVGFELGTVLANSADRHGVRDSIRARMERHGGTAMIRTSPGEGTEVRLRMPRPKQEG